jgi:hypothetical protein
MHSFCCPKWAVFKKLIWTRLEKYILSELGDNAYGNVRPIVPRHGRTEGEGK